MSHFIPKLTPLKWFVILTVITIGLALGLPPDPHAVHQLHTSAFRYRIAVAVLLIPYIVIWYFSFLAFAKLREYSQPLKKTEDGAAFHAITVGMGVLAFTLVVPTMISLVLSGIATHTTGFKAAAIIINNYLSLFPALIAFLLILKGSRELLKTAKVAAEQLDLRWYAPIYLLLSVAFSHLAIGNQYRYHPYHLALWLLITTFIVPYLYAWAVGLQSAYNLTVYAKTINGALYRQAIKQFARGISVAIIGSIAIQFVNVTIAHRLHSLGGILLIDYGLLIIMAVGLGLMAFGTKKLKRFEEV